MKKAIYNDTVIAESDKTTEASSYDYFPMDSINMKYLKDNDHSSVCPFKGTARYFDVVVEDKKSVNAAWIYPVPKEGFEYIKNHIAFWKDVKVE